MSLYKKQMFLWQKSLRLWREYILNKKHGKRAAETATRVLNEVLHTKNPYEVYLELIQYDQITNLPLHRQD